MFEVIAAVVGVAAWAVSAICDWGTEREVHRCHVIQWRRDGLLRKRRLEARRQAERLLRAAIRVAKEERAGILQKLARLRPERDRFVDGLKKRLPDGNYAFTADQRRKMRDAMREFDDVVDDRRAYAHRFSAFIDEAEARIATMREGTPTLGAAEWARSLKLSEFFAATDVPVRGRVVRAVVRSPKRGLWFQLDAGVKARLADGEKADRWASGGAVKVFIDRVDYKGRTAVVSHQRAAFLTRWDAGQRMWHATVVRSDIHGTTLSTSGVRVFVPARYGRPDDSVATHQI
jgi:hypothetical protein